eukprot:g4372.t1
MPKRRVRLSDVQTLTFQRGEFTRSNKNQRVEKVTCLSGCDEVGEDIVSQSRCKNDGMHDLGDVNWRCTASIPKGCRFLDTTVSCERFRDEYGHYDEDEDWIVPGSCAFEFSLDCERLSSAQEEESRSKQRIEERRREQQEMMLAEVRRSRDQASRDACELAIASALYPLNSAVSIGSYDHGHISKIDCDGLYSVMMNNGSERRFIKESELSPYVEPQYVMYDDTFQRGNRARHSYSGSYGSSSSSKNSYSGSYGSSSHYGSSSQNSYSGSYGSTSSEDPEWSTTFTIIFCVVTFFLIYLFFSKNSSRTNTPRRTTRTRRTTSSQQRPSSSDDGVNPNEPNSHRTREFKKAGWDTTGLAKTAVAAALHAASMHNSSTRSRSTTKNNVRQRSTGGTRVKQRDIAKEENIRASKIDSLTQLQKSRVVAKQAELKQKEDARVREYKARMAQSQRNVTNDTQQHGNQMRRTDHVRDRTEGVAYAKTKFR